MRFGSRWDAGLAAVGMTNRGENEGDAAPGGGAGTLHLSMCLRNQGLSPVLYEFNRRGLRASSRQCGGICHGVLTGGNALWDCALQQPFETMVSSELRAGDPPQVTRQIPHE
ncbi:hypothetical protein [Ktedonobacter racemifer]|nr:hypothetical protein [Ktedonobacter racemifer]